MSNYKLLHRTIVQSVTGTKSFASIAQQFCQSTGITLITKEVIKKNFQKA